MLLWPHRQIPDNDFIDERLQHDSSLLDEAIAKLQMFAYVDLVENPRLYTNLQAWLHRPVVGNVVNETIHMPDPLRTQLHLELKPEVLDLLQLRSRLDVRLWNAVAEERSCRLSPESLRMRAILLNAARHALLLAP